MSIWGSPIGGGRGGGSGDLSSLFTKKTVSLEQIIIPEQTCTQFEDASSNFNQSVAIAVLQNVGEITEDLLNTQIIVTINQIEYECTLTYSDALRGLCLGAEFSPSNTPPFDFTNYPFLIYISDSSSEMIGYLFIPSDNTYPSPLNITVKAAASIKLIPEQTITDFSINDNVARYNGLTINTANLSKSSLVGSKVVVTINNVEYEYIIKTFAIDSNTTILYFGADPMVSSYSYNFSDEYPFTVVLTWQQLIISLDTYSQPLNITIKADLFRDIIVPSEDFEKAVYASPTQGLRLKLNNLTYGTQNTQEVIIYDSEVELDSSGYPEDSNSNSVIFPKTSLFLSSQNSNSITLAYYDINNTIRYLDIPTSSSSGSGDMAKSDYDSSNEVFNVGGIPNYVNNNSIIKIISDLNVSSFTPSSFVQATSASVFGRDVSSNYGTNINQVYYYDIQVGFPFSTLTPWGNSEYDTVLVKFSPEDTFKLHLCGIDNYCAQYFSEGNGFVRLFVFGTIDTTQTFSFTPTVWFIHPNSNYSIQQG